MAASTTQRPDFAGQVKLFRELRRTKDPALRDRLIEANTGLAYHFADRYADRGLEREDLRQVGLVGLVKAVDRFDPEHGASFATFARRFITGEIRHHFRDRGWELRVPRSVKQLHSRLPSARSELTAKLGQEPTPAELAEYLDISIDEVLEAMDAAGAWSTKSLDQRRAALGSAAEPPTEELGYLTVQRREVLARLLQDVDERERRILQLRFVEEWSQDRIAQEVDVSQVHVSRLIRRTLAELRVRAEEMDLDLDV